MPQYRKLTRNEYPSTDPNRQGRIDVAYVYLDEKMHTIMIQIPLEEDSEARVLQELQAHAERAKGGGPEEVSI